MITWSHVNMLACEHVHMRAWRRAAIAVVVLGAVPAAPVTPCGWCATEFTQVMNNVELLGVNATQARSLATQFRQFELQLRNARSLTDPRDVLALTESFRSLVNIVETTRGVSLHATDVDERYRAEFGGFDRYAGETAPTAETLTARYRRWSGASHESIRAALRAAGLHAAAFYDEQATLRALERRAVGADGMLKVAQAGAQIAALQVEEGRKLRALLTAQMQMQGNLAAATTDRRDASDADLERYLRPPPRPEPGEGITTDDFLRARR